MQAGSVLMELWSWNQIDDFLDEHGKQMMGPLGFEEARQGAELTGPRTVARTRVHPPPYPHGLLEARSLVTSRAEAQQPSREPPLRA